MSEAALPATVETLPAEANPQPASILRVPLGRLGLPPNTARQVMAFRLAVERALLATGKPLSIWHASKVRTVCVALSEAKRAQIRLSKGGLDAAAEQGWSDRLVKHQQAVDRALAELGLDKGDLDPWDAIYRPQALQASAQASANGSSRPEAHLDATDAPDAKPEAQEGNSE